MKAQIPAPRLLWVIVSCLTLYHSQLPTSDYPENIVHGILENLGLALKKACPLEQTDRHISRKCVSSKLSQQQLFAGAFYFHSDFLRL